MVSLSRGGQSVKIGKRLGTAVWLRDVIAEAGKDATRYFFVMRRSDAQLDFDIELATKKSLDNPVYYAQMGHARMCSIARRAKEAGVPDPEDGEGALDALVLPEELGMIKTMGQAPDVIADAADAHEPHQVVYFIQDLIGQFHSYFTQYKNTEKVVSDDGAKTRARLLMCQALRTTLRALLGVLGVDAPDRMVLEEEAEA
jgi:arginyl-tRNA synthetase